MTAPHQSHRRSTCGHWHRPPHSALQYLSGNRHAWLQVASGQVVVNGKKMMNSDGLSVSNEELLTVSADIPAVVLLFDLS